MKKERIPTNTDNSSNLLVNFQKIDKDGDIFKQMFKYSVVPTIIHDMKMNIINANDRAVEQFGYSRQELLKKNIFDLHTENELNHSKEVLNEMQQKDKLSVETSFKRKDGSIFFAEATPCKFLLSNKPIIHVFIQDITERKKTEIELKDYNKQLNNRNKELEQFTYITSHDLQEPLNSIISFAGLLNEDKEKLDELGAKSVTVILNSAQRMKDFITSILDYSRIGKRQEIATVDIRKLIENLKIDLTDLIEKENATLSYIGEPLKIMAFKHDLIKLFQNIVSNGIK